MSALFGASNCSLTLFHLLFTSPRPPDSTLLLNPSRCCVVAWDDAGTRENFKAMSALFCAPNPCPTLFHLLFISQCPPGKTLIL